MRSNRRRRAFPQRSQSQRSSDLLRLCASVFRTCHKPTVRLLGFQVSGFAVIRELAKPVAFVDCVRLLAKSCAAIIVCILMAVKVGTHLGSYESTALLGKVACGRSIACATPC